MGKDLFIRRYFVLLESQLHLIRSTKQFVDKNLITNLSLTL
jgi:hypothetical protein